MSLDDSPSIADLSAALEAELASNGRGHGEPGHAEMKLFVGEHLSTEPTPATRLLVTPDEYFQLPGFNASCAKTVITRSPAHALAEHPWFGDPDKKVTKEMDLGSVLHTLTLGKGKRFWPVNASDWRTKAAQLERDQAREQGLVPFLRHKLDAAKLCAERIKAQLAAHGLALDGESEVALEWSEETERGHVRCRGMLDHVWLDRGCVLDLKIVGDASAEAVEKSAERFGYAVQEAAYRRALTRLRPELVGRIDFVFAFCEATPPYAVNLVRGDGMFREVGERRWSRAVQTWATCLATNTWPCFGAGINSLGVPMWALRNEGYES